MPSSGVSEDCYSVLMYNNKSIFGQSKWASKTDRSEQPSFPATTSWLTTMSTLTYIHKINLWKKKKKKPLCIHSLASCCREQYRQWRPGLWHLTGKQWLYRAPYVLFSVRSLGFLSGHLELKDWLRLTRPKSPKQWFLTCLMLWPFNVVSPTIKLFHCYFITVNLALLHTLKIHTLLHTHLHNVNIWYAGYLIMQPPKGL